MEAANAVEVVQTLDERRDHIMDTLETAAHEVGRELIAAKQEHPGRFVAWVTRELPFGIDKAEKLMAVARMVNELPPEAASSLPKAWTTLFELSRFTTESLRAAIAAGEVDQSTTQAAVKDMTDDELGTLRRLITGTAEIRPTKPKDWVSGPKPGAVPAANRRLDTDALAREVIQARRDELSPAIERLLRRWLDPEETP